MTDVRAVPLDAIRADPSAQPRAAMLTDEVALYVERMAEGDAFPPMTVFFDGNAYWLADGFHRYHAARGLGLADFPCDVRSGDLRDAILFSVGANHGHGIRRTPDDKRRAVARLLADREWVRWSDREIARQCRVSHEFVRQERAKLVTVNVDSEPRSYTTKHGTPSVMNTANIGRRYPDAPTPKPAEIDRLQSLGIAPERAAQIEHDNRHGWISCALWEIERKLDELPDDPIEAARLFPACHRHTFTADKLKTMAAWLASFADEWVDNEGVFNVAAE